MPPSSDPGSARSCLLVVEDDLMVRDTLELMLEDYFEIRTAESIDAALSHLAATDVPPIELMLLDCLLPNGSVRDVLNAADARSIGVVLISGDPGQAEAVDPTRLFLPKPFTQSMLLAVLDRVRR